MNYFLDLQVIDKKCDLFYLFGRLRRCVIIVIDFSFAEWPCA